MAITSCMGCSTECVLLVIVVTGLSILSPVWCQECDTQRGKPQINISSTPPFNNLSIGAAINLTCTAWQTKELAKDSNNRPHKIKWYDPQGELLTDRTCDAGSKNARLMNCTLEIGNLTEGKLGNYECQASNGYHECSTKRYPVYLQQDTKPSEFVIVPVNQTAFLGSNVTFNCSATGYPKPTITWEKVNDSGSVLYNPTAKILTSDGNSIVSQLVITEVKSKDYGIYRCVAKNGVGHNISVIAVLVSRGEPGPEEKEDTKPSEFVIVPVNQTAFLGSNVTFNCSATGYPKPTITWEKVNDSGSVLYNPTAKILTSDGNSIVSQLVITEVKSKDYGIYRCVAKNGVGHNISVIAVLVSRGEPGPEEKEGPSTTSKKKNGEIVAISVTLSVAIMFLGAVIVFLQPFRRRCSRNQTYDNTNHATLTRQIEEEDQLEATYDYIDNNPPLITPQEHDKVPLSGHSPEENPLLGTSGPVKKPPQGRPLPPIPHIEKVGQTMEENSEQNVTCLRMLQSESQNPDFQTPDNGRRGNILEGQGIPLDIEKNTGTIPVLQENGKEPWLLPSSGSMGETEAETKPMLNVLGFDFSPGEPLKVRELLPTADFEAAPPRPPKPTRETEEGTKYNESSPINSQEIEEDYEIDFKRLEVQDEVLGEGEFGIVYRGRYHGKDTKVIDVAVKQLKDTAVNNDKAALLSEIQMLKQAGKHPNIVNLVGACTKGENILLVTELIPGGTLESFLTSKPAPGEHGKYENFKCALNDRELIKIALQIASGMQHLESKKCIHGDVAARNVFIDKNNKIAKLGDFGLARDISDRGIYNKTSNGRVPWRWLSLESLRYRVYTSQSDVWSFGILLWEIATFGELPYPDIATPWALRSFLSSGKRMPRPDHCTEELYALMQSCWMENPLMRPSFQDVTKRIRYFLRKVKKSYVNVEDDDITDDSETQRLTHA